MLKRWNAELLNKRDDLDIIEGNNVMESIDQILQEITTQNPAKQKKHGVGTMCLFVPRELIQAMGVPHQYLPKLSSKTEGKSERISRIEDNTFCDTICLHSKFSYIDQSIKNGNEPDVFIFPITCDPFTRLFEYIGDDYPIYYLSLPRKRGTAAASEYWYHQITDLKKYLEKKFNVILQHNRLRDVIALENEIRKQMRHIFFSRKNSIIPLSSSEARKIQVMYQDFDRELCLSALLRIRELVIERIAMHESAYPPEYPRVLLITTTTRDFELGPNGNAKTTLKMLEEAGCAVVAEDACSTQTFQQDIPLDTDDGNLMRNLSNFYLNNIYCPCFLSTQDKLDHILKQVSIFRVDGVIIRNLKFCRHFNGNTENIRQELEKIGVPTLVYETTGLSDFGIGRIQTQLESFVDIMKIRKSSRKEELCISA